MCTAKCSADTKAGRLAALRARLHSTSGGSSDTELKLFTVRPTSRPAVSRVVTTVTPVVKVPSALRNARLSMFVSARVMQSSQRGRRNRDVAERTFVGARLGRQAERALGQDVAKHLIGAAFDAVDRAEAEHLVELAHLGVACRGTAVRVQQVPPDGGHRL